MRRKLLALNVTLLLLTVYAGWQLRQSWRAAKARDAAELGRKVPPAPPPPFTALPPAPPVVAGGYAEIAQKTLFDRSRNPAVAVELPPAPPPVPMPPLPAFYGLMNLGDGPMAILSLEQGGEQAVHIGETIGQFKLVDVNTEEIALEWNGQTVRKKLNQMAASQAAPAQPAAPRMESGPPAGTVPPPPPPPPTRAGPGNDVGNGFRSCVPNDTTPVGSVVDGYRKLVASTPFGDSCTWVAVK